MELERRDIVEAVASTFAVAVFIAAIVVVSQAYNGASSLDETGGLVIVAAMAGFILLMTGIGIWLSRKD
jgi:hypothetical protein